MKGRCFSSTKSGSEVYSFEYCGITDKTETYNMESKTEKKIALNGVVYRKNDTQVWCVTSTRIQKAHRRIYQRMFADDKSAVEYFKGIDKYFTDRNPEAELTKSDWLQLPSGEIRKCNKTYTFGGSPWDKQIFHLKKMVVLELDNSHDADGDTEKKNIYFMSRDDMVAELSGRNYSMEYLQGLDDEKLKTLYDAEFCDDDNF